MPSAHQVLQPIKMQLRGRWNMARRVRQHFRHVLLVQIMDLGIIRCAIIFAELDQMIALQNSGAFSL